MKTNHQRGFIAQNKKVRYFRLGVTQDCQIADHSVGAKYFGFGAERQNRRFKAGGKKFVRSRVRFHDNQALRQLVKEIEV